MRRFSTATFVLVGFFVLVLSQVASASSDTTWAHYTLEMLSITTGATEVESAENGHFWIGSTGEAVGLITPEALGDGFANVSPGDLFPQTILHHSGMTWVGHQYSGISWFDGAEWATINREDGLLSHSVSSIAVTSDGLLWVGHGAHSWGMSGGGLSYQQDGEWQTMAEFSGMGSNSVSELQVGPNGHIWVGVTDYPTYWGEQNGGVMTFDGTSWTTFGPAEGLTHTDVRALQIAQNGDVWVATTDGVYAYDGTSWTAYTTANGLTNNLITDLEIDSEGRIWAATYHGMNVFDGTSWATITETDGLPSNVVRAISADDLGGIIIASDTHISQLRLEGGAVEPQQLTHTLYMPIVIKSGD